MRKMKNDLKLEILAEDKIPEIASLLKQLNPNLTIEVISGFLKEMFALKNYVCFALYNSDKLIGVSSGWLTIRIYSGRQLEVDNVIIDSSAQSQGFGKIFFGFIESWAKQHKCETIELNTYVQNSKSHKFYFNNGFSILGFHFRKQI